MTDFQEGDCVRLESADGHPDLERFVGRSGDVESVGVKVNAGHYQVQFEAVDGWTEDPNMNTWVPGELLEPVEDGGTDASAREDGDAALDLDVSEDVTLKPHPEELESAVNGDHTVQFTFTDADPMFRLDIQGEPLDSGDWVKEWTYLDVPAEKVPAIVASEGEQSHTVEKNGARFQVTGEVVQR